MVTQTSVFAAGARPALLQCALQIDALFSGVCGVTGLLAAAPLTTLTGWGPSLVFQGLGIFLLAWAGRLFYGTARWPKLARLGWMAVVGNSLWVLGSIGLLLTRLLPLTPVGTWLMIAQAVIVAVFAAAQLMGLWRLRRV